MRLIAIGGSKGHGKTYFINTAKEIAAKQGLKVVSLAFSDPLKEALAAMFGVDRAQMEEQEFKRSISPLFSEQEGRFWTWREVMQRFGTEAMEGGFTPSVWRQIAFAKILKILQEQKPDIILLDGLRVLHQSQDLLKWEEAFKGIPHPQYALSPEVLAALPPIEILTLGVKNVTLPESTDPHPTEKDMVDHWQEMFANELRHEGKDTPKYQESVAALLGL